MSPRQPGRPANYAAAERWVASCLRKDGGLFSDASIWSRASLDDLYERFVGHPDESRDTFEAKLARQLDEAPDATVQLAGELLYVHFLPASRIGGKRKRELINRILGWMREPAEIPSDLDAALDTGLMNMGVAFNTGRNFGLAFLLDFARAWKALEPEKRDRLLADPWAFKIFVFDLPIFSAYAQREGLLHLVHPDTFENIANAHHKAAIADSFGDLISEQTSDVDRKLVGIRAKLTEQMGRDFEFYEPGLYEKWQRDVSEGTQPGSPTPEEVPLVRRAWLIRGTTKAGDSLVPAWLEGSFVSIGWAEAGPMEPGIDRQEIRDRIAESFPEYALTRAGLTAGMIDRFLNRMEVGDLVVAPRSKDIYVGIITSEPEWLPMAPGQPVALSRRREVEWTNATSPTVRDRVSDGLYSKMRTLLTLTDVSDHVDEIAAIAGIAGEVVVESVAPTLATLPPADDALEESTLLTKAWLQEVLDLLERKRQVVFFGPPGTGKTFVAQRLGDHIVAAGGNYRLVQFHPSYTYEDFFEGFRPRESGSGDGVSFELVSGPLKVIAEAAIDDPSHPYLLIIDEINRANIAKVFGELYFLLEYRDAAVSLLYSPEQEFTLPRNLYIIGTMNTADRSIALIDTAMRRRFYFLRFSPDVEPIASLLRRWLSDRHMDLKPAVLLETLNKELGDADFSIGPSYLMDERILDEGELERVWTHALIPLLDEHFFGSSVDVQSRFGLAALQQPSPTHAEEPEISDEMSDGD